VDLTSEEELRALKNSGQKLAPDDDINQYKPFPWWPNSITICGQTLPDSHQKSKSEARNLPPCGCESMTEGPRNVLGVFITLLYTHTMPIKHYSSKPTSLRCHLMAKHCLKVARLRYYTC